MLVIHDKAAELRAEYPALRAVAPLPWRAGSFDPKRPAEEFARLAANWRIRRPADPAQPGLVRGRSLGACLKPLTAKERLFDPALPADDGDLVLIEMHGMFLRNMARAKPGWAKRYPDGVSNVCAKLLVHGIDGSIYVANRSQCFRLSVFGVVLGTAVHVEG